MRDPGLTFTNPASGSSTAVKWNGGTGMFAVQGTFNNATIKLQHQIGDGASAVWQDIGADATLASGSVLFTTSSPALQVVNSAHSKCYCVCAASLRKQSVLKYAAYVRSDLFVDPWVDAGSFQNASLNDSNSAIDVDGMATAAAGYSVRKLRAAYTGKALKVGRASDGDEADVAFDTVGQFLHRL